MADQHFKKRSSVTLPDLDRIAIGATVLGSGGGGDPYLCRLAVKNALQNGKTIEIVNVDDLPENAFIVCVGGFGAPTVESEKLHSIAGLQAAIIAYQQMASREIDALIPAEMGGANSLIPMLAAAESGLPLIDGDGMARAFPELQMTSYFLEGVSATPFVMADEHENVVVCNLANGLDTKKGEAFARNTSIVMGLTSYLACYGMDKKQASSAVLQGTLTLAKSIGLAIEKARESYSPLEVLIGTLRNESHLNARLLFEGKIADLWRETKGGFAVGWCELEGLESQGSKGRTDFQNEFLRFQVDGETRAIAPDLITVLDRDTLEPIPVPDIKYGQRVAVLGLACHPRFREPDALALFGPQVFKFKQTYQPLEDLNPDNAAES